MSRIVPAALFTSFAAAVATVALATPALATDGTSSTSSTGSHQVCFTATYDAASDKTTGDTDKITFRTNAVNDETGPGSIDFVLAGALKQDNGLELNIVGLTAKVFTGTTVMIQGAHQDAGPQQSVQAAPGSTIVSATATACGMTPDTQPPVVAPGPVGPPVVADPPPHTGCGFVDPSVAGGWVATDCFPNPVPQTPVVAPNPGGTTKVTTPVKTNPVVTSTPAASAPRSTASVTTRAAVPAQATTSDTHKVPSGHVDAGSYGDSMSANQVTGLRMLGIAGVLTLITFSVVAIRRRRARAQG